MFNFLLFNYRLLIVFLINRLLLITKFEFNIYWCLDVNGFIYSHLPTLQ
jgi:hypothetical protein